MGIPWTSHGNSNGIPWASHGHPVEISRASPGLLVGILCASHENSMAISWALRTTHGMPMGFLRAANENPYVASPCVVPMNVPWTSNGLLVNILLGSHGYRMVLSRGSQRNPMGSSVNSVATQRASHRHLMGIPWVSHGHSMGMRGSPWAAQR